MALNTNPQAVLFTNQRTRPACDAFMRAYRSLQECVSEYASQGIGPIVAPDQTTSQEIVNDAAYTAGGTPLLGYDVDNANSQMQAFLNWLAANPAVLAALTKPSVASLPAF